MSSKEQRYGGMKYVEKDAFLRCDTGSFGVGR